MMLATWLVEFYLSKCNELDDLVASESVSQDVDNLLAERAILEDDLRHFFETYKVVPVPVLTDNSALMYENLGESRSQDSLRADTGTWPNRHVSALCHGRR